MGASIERDFIGYGSNVPHIAWPDGATVAVNLVLVYEEGSEYSVVEGDGRNDGWGEYHTNVGPEIRDLGSETHFEYGSRAGVWRLTRLIDQYQVPVTVSATARALERNPAVANWMRAHNHDLLGHGLRWTEMYTLSRDEERAQQVSGMAVRTGNHGSGSRFSRSPVVYWPSAADLAPRPLKIS